MLTVYTKGGGSYGTHNWTACAGNIGTVSYVAAQTFESLSSRSKKFLGLHSDIAHLRVRKYELVSANDILCRITDFVRLGETDLELSDSSFWVWQHLTANIKGIEGAFRKKAE